MISHIIHLLAVMDHSMSGGGEIERRAARPDKSTALSGVTASNPACDVKSGAAQQAARARRTECCPGSQCGTGYADALPVIRIALQAKESGGYSVHANALPVIRIGGHGRVEKMNIFTVYALIFA